MNPTIPTSDPASHLTIDDLDRASLGSTSSLNFSMLHCSCEDCLIATHEFDTSPLTTSPDRAEGDGLSR
jgi:hypothetical protein